MRKAALKDNNNSLAVPNLHIPPEAVERSARDLCRAMGSDPDEVQSDGENEWPLWWEFRKPATAAIRAALAAWPGMNHDSQAWRGYGGEVLILPLTTEPRDD